MFQNRINSSSILIYTGIYKNRIIFQNEPKRAENKKGIRSLASGKSTDQRNGQKFMLKLRLSRYSRRKKNFLPVHVMSTRVMS